MKFWENCKKILKEFKRNWEEILNDFRKIMETLLGNLKYFEIDVITKKF